MDDGDGLLRALELGVEAGEDVGVVLAGEGEHGVEGADVGLLEQVGVGDLALEDERVR